MIARIFVFVKRHSSLSKGINAAFLVKFLAGRKGGFRMRQQGSGRFCAGSGDCSARTSKTNER
jgi:hypothetical protein